MSVQRFWSLVHPADRRRVEAAWQAAPEDPAFNRLHGEVLLYSGKKAEAEAAFRRAIELDPNDLVPPHPQPLGHAPGRLELEPVALAVVDGQGMAFETLALRDGQRGGGIESAG